MTIDLRAEQMVYQMRSCIEVQEVTLISQIAK
jgi:hypothetical protein